MAQFGRVSALGAERRRFKSCHSEAIKGIPSRGVAVVYKIFPKDKLKLTSLVKPVRVKSPERSMR